MFDLKPREDCETVQILLKKNMQELTSDYVETMKIELEYLKTKLRKMKKEKIGGMIYFQGTDLSIIILFL